MFKKILMGVVLLALVLIAGVACSSFISKAPAPKSDTHIIPQLTPTPAPEPKTHNYVYNPVEYYIAINGSSDLEWALGPAGYNISKQEITEFQKQHKIRRGDRVFVQGRVKIVNYGIIRFDSAFILELHWTLDVYPKWARDLRAKVESGEEAIILVQGTAESIYVIKDSELIEIK